MSQAITLSPSMTRYFQEVVDEAMRARNVEATEAASRYLVALLCAFAHPDDEVGSTFREPLTFLLRDALASTGAERFRRLRGLGDGVLYCVGFFGGHIELKGVDRRYVVGVGSTAYQEAAAMLRVNERLGGGPDVLSEMAAKFDRFAKVLSDVADRALASGARDEQSVLRLYERWVRTGSARLAEALGARGLVPTRGTGDLN